MGNFVDQQASALFMIHGCAGGHAAAARVLGVLVVRAVQESPEIARHDCAGASRRHDVAYALATLRFELCVR
jgi:hypothetical protein